MEFYQSVGTWHGLEWADIRANEVQATLRELKSTSKYANNPKLGGWASYQRNQYRLLKSGKKSFISDEKIELLEKLGFQWNYDSQLSLTKTCNERFSQLMMFKQQWGHCNVPQDMLRTQSSGAGRDTREVNIDCWRVERSPQSVMRRYQNWKTRIEM